MILGTGTSAMVLEIAAPTLKQLYSVLVDWRVAMNARATNKTDGLVSYTCFLQCKDHPYLVRLRSFLKYQGDLRYLQFCRADWLLDLAE